MLRSPKLQFWEIKKTLMPIEVVTERKRLLLAVASQSVLHGRVATNEANGIRSSNN